MKNTYFHISTRIFYLNQAGKTISNVQFYESGSPKMMHNGGNDANLKIG